MVDLIEREYNHRRICWKYSLKRRNNLQNQCEEINNTFCTLTPTTPLRSLPVK